MVPVVVDLKTAPMSFPTAEDQKSFSPTSRSSCVFPGPENEVVKKIGQHYEMAENWTARHREEQRSALLPRAGAAAGRLHDGTIA